MKEQTESEDDHHTKLRHEHEKWVAEQMVLAKRLLKTDENHDLWLTDFKMPVLDSAPSPDAEDASNDTPTTGGERWAPPHRRNTATRPPPRSAPYLVTLNGSNLY